MPWHHCYLGNTLTEHHPTNFGLELRDSAPSRSSWNAMLDYSGLDWNRSNSVMSYSNPDLSNQDSDPINSNPDHSN